MFSFDLILKINKNEIYFNEFLKEIIINLYSYNLILMEVHLIHILLNNFKNKTKMNYNTLSFLEYIFNLYFYYYF